MPFFFLRSNAGYLEATLSGMNLMVAVGRIWIPKGYLSHWLVRSQCIIIIPTLKMSSLVKGMA